MRNIKEATPESHELLRKTLESVGIILPTIKNKIEAIDIPKKNKEKIVRNYTNNTETLTPKEEKQQKQFKKNSLLMARMNKY